MPESRDAAGQRREESSQSQAASQRSGEQPSGQPSARPAEGQQGQQQWPAEGQPGRVATGRQCVGPGLDRRRAIQVAAAGACATPPTTCGAPPRVCSSRIRPAPARAPTARSSGCAAPKRRCADRPPTTCAGGWVTCSSKRASWPTPSAGLPRRCSGPGACRRCGRAWPPGGRPSRSAWRRAPTGSDSSSAICRGRPAARTGARPLDQAGRELESGRAPSGCAKRHAR